MLASPNDPDHAVRPSRVQPPAAAQYPERPVTLLAGYPPGGQVDVVARLVAEGMKTKFPRGIAAVVNRPGAAGSVAVAELVRRWF